MESENNMSLDSELKKVFVALTKNDIENIRNALQIVEEESSSYENPLDENWKSTAKKFYYLFMLTKDEVDGIVLKEQEDARAIIKINNLFVIDWK